MTKDVSIIMANYNGADMTKRCIDSIREHTNNLDYEIVLIDDHSKESDYNQVSQIPDVIFSRNENNIGELATKNKGIQISKGKYVLICDNDILLQNNTIKQMFDYMEENPEVGATAPMLVFKDGSFQKSHGPMFIPPLKLLINKITRVFNPKSKKLKEVDWINSAGADRSIHYTGHVKGAFCMVRRETIEKAGLMDEQYIVYADEIDWQYRMQKFGYKSVHLPFGPVIHFGGATNKADIEGLMKWESHSLKNSVLFCKKHYGVFNTCVYRFTMMLTMLANIIRFKDPNKRRVYKAMFRVLFQKVENKPVERRDWYG